MTAQEGAAGVPVENLRCDYVYPCTARTSLTIDISVGVKQLLALTCPDSISYTQAIIPGSENRISFIL